jgi:undecaprenyl-diphosphatase
MPFFQNNLDNQIFQYFLNHRNDFGIKIFKIISFLGNWQFVLPIMVIILLILFYKKRGQFIIPFIFTVLVAEMVTFFGKIISHRARPLSAVIFEPDFSFPSGHATIAVAFYGYLTYLIVISLKSKPTWLITSLSLILIIAIGFSRLYLGVHYFTDVVAGYLVGSLFLFFGIRWTKKLLSK